MESNQTEFIIEMDNENIIGKGGFGTVYPAYEKGDYLKKTKYAAKSVPELVRTNQKEMTAFQNEILIATQFENENLVKFHGLTEVDNHMYMIFEYCNGGDLNNFITKYKEKYNKEIEEKDALIIIKGITNGLYCLHRNGITHRDIKPANILLHFENKEALENLDLNKCTVKIADFGLSIFRATDDGSSKAGTKTYMDPLIIFDDTKDSKKRESDKTDIWSLGILCYKLLFQSHPFIDHYAFKNQTYMTQYAKNVQKGKYDIPIYNTTKISLESICFIDSCLKKEQNYRKTSEELVYSRFLTRPYEKFNFVFQDNIEKVINENLREKNISIILNIFDKELFEDKINI
jgi:serine/threonine protein kinase